VARVYLLAVCLTACTKQSLTHARPRPPDCQVQANGADIVCGREIAATLRCTHRGYEACNVLVLTYSDGEAVTLHQLRNDPKFDTVGDVAVERSGARIWFTESDLSAWAMLRGFGGGSGMSSRARVFDVWTGIVRDADDAASGVAPRVERGEAVRLPSEVKPTPGKP
jgi:hypothetical protein